MLNVLFKKSRSAMHFKNNIELHQFSSLSPTDFHLNFPQFHFPQPLNFSDWEGRLKRDSSVRSKQENKMCSTAGQFVQDALRGQKRISPQFRRVLGRKKEKKVFPTIVKGYYYLTLL